MTKTYDFDERLKAGNKEEQYLDQFFSRWFEITPATTEEQRQGIDRHFVNRESGVASTVDYKADWAASRTGNAFIETVSVDTNGKLGWAQASKAYRILYYLPSDGIVYILLMSTIRRHLPIWTQKYPVKVAKNNGYATHGVVVPLREIERCSEEVKETYR